MDDLETPARTLAVPERGSDEPIHRMLAGLFADRNVEVEVATDDLPEVEGGRRRADRGRRRGRLLTDGGTRTGDPVVNSDLYTTGTRALVEADLPEVLTRLSDARFSLRGYPLAHKEKLLLIAVSRRIELRAFRAGAGTLRASFQRLSRIEDERGTRRDYEALGGTGLDVRVYGEPDADAADSLPLAVREGYGDEYSDPWFVVFRPGDGADEETAALIALETSPRLREGFWTVEPDLVADIDRTVGESLWGSEPNPFAPPPRTSRP